MNHVSLTLSIQGEDPLTVVVGTFNTIQSAMSAYSRMKAAAELICWHEQNGSTGTMVREKRKESNAQGLQGEG